MNNDGVSPKHEAEIKRGGETMHSTLKYTTESTVVESESTATGEGTGAGAQTGEATTNKIDSATQNLVDENEIHDPETQPSKLPDPNAQKPLQPSPTSDRACKILYVSSREYAAKPYVPVPKQMKYIHQPSLYTYNSFGARQFAPVTCGQSEIFQVPRRGSCVCNI